MIEDIIECQRLADIVNDERLHEVSRCQIMKAFLFDGSIPFKLFINVLLKYSYLWMTYCFHVYAAQLQAGGERLTPIS